MDNIKQHENANKKANIWHWLKYDVNGVISRFSSFLSNLATCFLQSCQISNICGGTQVLEIVIFQPSLNRF